LPFLQDVEFPVVAANVDLSKACDLQTIPSLHSSIVLTVNEAKVGIIGYLTPDTEFLAKPNYVDFYPEYAAIKYLLIQNRKEFCSFIILFLSVKKLLSLKLKELILL